MPKNKFDRTNINNGIYQTRQSNTEASKPTDLSLRGNIFPALVLSVSSPFLYAPTATSPIPLHPLSGDRTHIPTMKIKIHFRVEKGGMHASIPLPPLFKPLEKLRDSELEPDALNLLLISCHPHLYADFDSFSEINAGDQIEVRFEADDQNSAKIIKTEKKSVNNVPLQNSFFDVFGGLFPSLADTFDDAAETAILGSPSEPASLGKNQAKYYTEATRGPNEITNIVMHSTDGHSGIDRAQKTIDRFAEGPTLRFDWTHPDTGKIIINPSCAEVLKYGPLPEKTICQETRNQVEIPVKTSIHYAIDQGGNIIQGVLNKDIASHAGGSMNKVSIGIEMNGKPAHGPGLGLDGKYAKMYNETLINAAARLVAKLTTEYNIPAVRVTKPGQPGIIAHHNISSTRFDPGNNLGWAKKDIPPGKYWDWDDFLTRVKNYQGSSA